MPEPLTPYQIALGAATEANIELVKIRAAISNLIKGTLSPGVEVPIELNVHVIPIQDAIKEKVGDLKILLDTIKQNIK